jgi:hypothetical protein
MFWYVPVVEWQTSSTFISFLFCASPLLLGVAQRAADFRICGHGHQAVQVPKGKERKSCVNSNNKNTPLNPCLPVCPFMCVHVVCERQRGRGRRRRRRRSKYIITTSVLKLLDLPLKGPHSLQISILAGVACELGCTHIMAATQHTFCAFLSML